MHGELYTGMPIGVILRGGFSAHRVSPGSTKPAQGCTGRPCSTLYVTNVQDRPRFVVLGPRPYALDLAIVLYLSNAY